MLMELDLPFKVNTENIEELVKNATEWALTHGFVMKFNSLCNEDTVTFSPFTLLPTPFPKDLFNRVMEIQMDINEVVHRVAHDFKFLESCLKSAILVDEFTANLFKIYEIMNKDNDSEKTYSLGLFRSDYMLHGKSSGEIKQVEINTISSGLAAQCVLMTELHRYILNQIGQCDHSNNIVNNPSLEYFVEGLVSAWKLYDVPKAVILFLVEENTFNIGDQRLIEFEITSKYRNIRIIRRMLCDISTRGSLQGKALYIDDYEIAVVYFRDGYSPNHYNFPKSWETRLMIEKSNAIKCPSIGYHLAGTKKVQQVLSRPGMLEKFMNDSARVSSLRQVFAQQFSLSQEDNENGAVQRAIDEPQNFVLKPQREGGGNNLFGEELRSFLKDPNYAENSSCYILMERLQPNPTKNLLIRPGFSLNINPVQVLSELGIFGVILGNKTNIVMNKEAGYLLRTKLSSCNEGGVARGLSTLDTPYLI